MEFIYKVIGDVPWDWWLTLGVVVLWYVWTDCDALVFDHQTQLTMSLLSLLWLRCTILRMNSQMEKLCNKILFITDVGSAQTKVY